MQHVGDDHLRLGTEHIAAQRLVNLPRLVPTTPVRKRLLRNMKLVEEVRIDLRSLCVLPTARI